MVDKNRIARAQRLSNILGYPEWEDFLSLVYEKRHIASVSAYQTESEESDKWLGEVRGLDKIANLIQYELRLVKKAIDEGRIAK